jgi:hypothetical protein
VAAGLAGKIVFTGDKLKKHSIKNESAIKIEVKAE